MLFDPEKHGLSEADIALILARLEQGHTRRQIMAAFGLPEKVVTRIQRNEGAIKGRLEPPEEVGSVVQSPPTRHAWGATEDEAKAFVDAGIASGAEKPCAEPVAINPLFASVLMERNTHNRRIGLPVVGRYAADMKMGKWLLNTSCIGLDTTGKLTNGQHRLSAVIESGVTIVSFLAFGLEPDSQETEDNVKIRMVRDHLSLMGFKNTHVLAAVAATLLVYRRRGILSRQPYFRPGTQEIIKFATDHPEIQDSIDAIPVRGAYELGGRMILAFCRHVIAGIAGTDEADDFFDKFMTGVNLKHGSPILYVRNKFLVPNRRNIRYDVNDRAELILKGWNAYRRGEVVRAMALTGTLPEVEA